MVIGPGNRPNHHPGPALLGSVVDGPRLMVLGPGNPPNHHPGPALLGSVVDGPRPWKPT